jgi:competence protein ComEC
MGAAGAGLGLGALLQLQQAALWAPGAYLVAMAGGLVGLLALLRPGAPRAATSRRRTAEPALLALTLMAAALVLFGSAGWRAGQRLAPVLPAELEGRDLTLEGRVAELPRRSGGGWSFAFDVHRAWHGQQAVALPPRLVLGWYPDDADDGLGAGLSGHAGLPRGGETWRLTARLRQPRGLVNPHGFDVERAWFERGVRAVGTVRLARAESPRRLAPASPVSVLAWRQAVKDRIEAQVRDPRAAGVLAALSLGDQNAIDEGDWTVFRQTGVAHLVAISGLHVTMFAWLAQALVGGLWRRSAQALLWLPAPTAARLGGVLLALLYALFAGWGLPAQRTVGMLAVAALLSVSGVRWPWPVVWAASALAIVVADPWALMSPGFWLSFVAVGLLMASGSASGAVRPDGGEPETGQTSVDRKGRMAALASPLWRAMREGLRTQAIATIGLAPLTLVFFQQISLVGFVANLVAIPLVTFVITPLALLGALVPPLWTAGAWCVVQLSSLLAALAAWPWAAVQVAAAPGWAMASGLLGGALLVLPSPWRWRLLGLPLLLPLLVPPVERPAPGHFEVVAADVGQGTAVLVRTARHLLVYDTGPQYGRAGTGGDAGARVLLPLLRGRGETAVDLLVLSHRDTDHVGGAATLLRGLPVRGVLASLEPGHPLRRAAPGLRDCAAGQGWDWDGVRFEVLHPPAEAPSRAPANARSCVLRVSAGGRSLLLTGDIERRQEAALVQRWGEALRSDVLLVPHHGSQTSSSPALLAAVQPKLALVQAGYRNRYGHPHADVLERYAEAGVAVVSTVDCGAWSWRPAQAPLCEREQRRRYWHAPGGVSPR